MWHQDDHATGERLYSTLEELLRSKKIGEYGALTCMLYLSDKYHINRDKTREYITNEVERINRKLNGYDHGIPTEGYVRSRYDKIPLGIEYLNAAFGFIEMLGSTALMLYVGKPAMVYSLYFFVNGFMRGAQVVFSNPEDKLKITKEEVRRVLKGTPFYKYLRKSKLDGVEKYIKGEYTPKEMNYYSKYNIRWRAQNTLLTLWGIAGSAQLAQYNKWAGVLGLESAAILTMWLTYNNIALITEVGNAYEDWNLTLGDLEKKIFG